MMLTDTEVHHLLTKKEITFAIFLWKQIRVVMTKKQAMSQVNSGLNFIAGRNKIKLRKKLKIRNCQQRATGKWTDIVGQGILRMGGRRGKVSKTRAEISYRLNCELGIPAAGIPRHLGLCTSAIAKAIEKYESSQK